MLNDFVAFELFEWKKKRFPMFGGEQRRTSDKLTREFNQMFSNKCVLCNFVVPLAVSSNCWPAIKVLSVPSGNIELHPI
jgi:hypothetical protein